MRILVSGARNFDCDSLALRILSSIRTARLLNGHTGPVTVVEGACHVGRGGVDGAFHRAAKGLGMETERHPADWKTYGKAAGPRRNAEMVKLGADLGIACHPDLKTSKGTRDCVTRMLKAGIPVVLHASDDDPGRLVAEEDVK